MCAMLFTYDIKIVAGSAGPGCLDSYHTFRCPDLLIGAGLHRGETSYLYLIFVVLYDGYIYTSCALFSILHLAI